MNDIITRFFSKALNILFLYNVLGTCYGCLLGIMLLSLQGVLAVYIPIIELVKWYGFIAFGVLIFNIKPMIKKEYEDPKIEIQLKYIRDILKEANFSEKEKRIYWGEAINNIVKASFDNNMDKTDKKNSFNNNLFS